jgi:hypothetical protein
MCLDVGGSDCTVSQVNRNASSWTLNDKTVERCLATPTAVHCKLQISLYFLVIIIGYNFIKSAAMSWTLWYQREETFVTFGDALSSWLDTPDLSTKGRCLTSKHDVSSKSPPPGYRLQPGSVVYTRGQEDSWYRAVSSERWSSTMIVCLVTMVVAIASACAAVISVSAKGTSAMSLGYGAVDRKALLRTGYLDGLQGLDLAAVLVNVPQAFLSFTYLLYNSMLTCMHLAQEYSGYAVERKALRVSTPNGEQRSTYWLQLPYTYSIPLIATSATLHWLVSQSIFYVRIQAYLHGKEYNADSTSAVGFSPRALVTLAVLAFMVLTLGIILGFRRLENGIPMAASCSLALAAAAHRPEDDVDTALLPLKWGEVLDAGSETVDHCCFTSLEVREPVIGRHYA